MSRGTFALQFCLVRRFVRRNSAFTRLELVALLCVIAVVSVLFLPMLAQAKRKASRVACINNLKDIGLVHRIFATDNNDLFVFQIPIANGGTMEFTNNIVPHFQALSNELSTPKILICPERNPRTIPATSFAVFAPSNTDYFIGLLASQTNSASILAGETSFTINGAPHGHGLLRLSTNTIVSYPANLHADKRPPSLVLADGSAIYLNSATWRERFTAAGAETNLLLLP
jgi:hypothetical protein